MDVLMEIRMEGFSNPVFHGVGGTAETASFTGGQVMRRAKRTVRCVVS